MKVNNLLDFVVFTLFAFTIPSPSLSNTNQDWKALEAGACQQVYNKVKQYVFSFLAAPTSTRPEENAKQYT